MKTVKAPDKVPVSLIVPVCGEVAQLFETLESVFGMTVVPSEIIVVSTLSTSGVTDALHHLVRKCERLDLGIKIIERPKVFPGAARNAGVSEAIYDWVAFLDTGVAAAPDWLCELWGEVQRSQVDVVQGICEFIPAGALGEMLCAASYGVGARRAVLPASIVRKSIFKEVGGFESGLRAGEDILWLDLVRANNVRVATCVRAHVKYQHFAKHIKHALRKSFVYEVNAVVAGVNTPFRVALTLLTALGCVFALMLPFLATYMVSAYGVIRGVLDPLRRAAWKRWWSSWWQPLVLPLLVLLLDFSAMSGRWAAEMRFASKTYYVAGRPRPPQWSPLNLFLGFFSLSIASAFAFRILILPAMPELDGGKGFVAADARYFYDQSLQVAQRIIANGWVEWRPFPDINLYGNVAVASAVFARFGASAIPVVILNCLMHSLAGLLLFLVIARLGGTLPGRRTAALLAASFFMFAPSALNWFSQNLKDSYVILGLFLLLFAVFRDQWQGGRRQSFVRIALMLGGGSILIWWLRPYLLLIVLPAFFLSTLTMEVVGRYSHVGGVVARRAPIGALGKIIFLSFCVVALYQFQPNWALGTSESPHAKQGKSVAVDDGFEWKDASWVPDVVERKFELLAVTRLSLCREGGRSDAGTMLDCDRHLDSIKAMALFAPRAFLQAVLLPYPRSWVEQRGFAHRVIGVETALGYGCLAGLLFLGRQRSDPSVLAVFLWSTVFLAFYGLISANMGTLLRLRYPFVHVLYGIGLLGWCVFFSDVLRTYRFGALKRIVAAMGLAWIGAGKISLTVLALLFSGVLFLVRDLFLTSRLGVGAALDSIFLALLLPMFLVNTLVIPFGRLVTPSFKMAIEVGEREAIERLSGYLFCTFWFGVLGAPVLVLLGIVLFPEQADGSMLRLLVLGSVILIFSGPLVTLAGFLNSTGRQIAVASAQVVVPVGAICAIGFAAKNIAEWAIAGLVIGQLLNFVICWSFLNMPIKFGSTLRRKIKWGLLREPLDQMPAVIFSSSVHSVMVATAIYLGSTFGDGGASILNLALKPVVFSTSIISVAFAAVLLPEFAAARSAGDGVGKYDRLVVLLSLAAGLFGAVLNLMAPDLLLFLFKIAIPNEARLDDLVNLGAVGLLHLPLFAFASLFLNMCIAQGEGPHIVKSGVLALGVFASSILVFDGQDRIGSIVWGFCPAFFVFGVALAAPMCRDGLVSRRGVLVSVLSLSAFFLSSTFS